MTLYEKKKRDPNYSFRIAVHRRDTETVTALLKEGKLDLKLPSNVRMVEWAAISSNIDLFKQIITEFNPSPGSLTLQHSLENALSSSNYAIAKFLISYGVDATKIRTGAIEVLLLKQDRSLLNLMLKSGYLPSPLKWKRLVKISMRLGDFVSLRMLMNNKGSECECYEATEFMERRKKTFQVVVKKCIRNRIPIELVELISKYVI